MKRIAKTTSRKQWMLIGALASSVFGTSLAFAQPTDEPAPPVDASLPATGAPLDEDTAKQDAAGAAAVKAGPVKKTSLEWTDCSEPPQPIYVMPGDQLSGCQLQAQQLAFPKWSNRPSVDLEVVTQGRYSVKDGDNLSEIRLDRGEVGARLPMGSWLAAQFRAEAIRSVSDGGALGIDGDSTVLRVKYANVVAHGQFGKLTVEGGGGFLADPWIQAIETSYSLKPLSRTGSERLLGWQTADLAGMVRAAYGPARLTVNVGNGEGQRYPERNNGKTTTGVLEVVALHNTDARVTLLGMGRDGSVGPSRIRDRRAGGGATAVFDMARVGFDVVKAWGIGGDGAAEGTEIGGWAEANYQHHFFVGARGSTLGYKAGGRSSTFGGAISFGDTLRTGGEARVWLAVDRITNSGGAMPLAGADSGDETVIMLMLSGNALYSPKDY
ncbi:MAG TPA: hypothetical protein VGM90_24255 [Kofleriaceae bacterium]|jgi:hypothetical protein